MQKNITTMKKTELSLINLRSQLANKKQELQETELMQQVNDLNKQIFKQEKELKKQEQDIINYFIDNNLKEFKSLDWKRIMLHKNWSWTLVWYEDHDVPAEYWKEKNTISLDKAKLKKDFADWKVMLPNAELKINYKIKYDLWLN